MVMAWLTAGLRRPRRVALTGVVAAAMLAGTAGAPAARAATAKPKAKETIEHALIHWLNVKRAGHRMAPLARSADLTAAGHKHAAAMAKSRKVFHAPRLGTEVHSWLSLGEDVGSAGRLVDLEKAFLSRSPREVDLFAPSFRQVGVGAVKRDGLIY